LGGAFELRVSVSVPSGSAVYFPDTLPDAGAIESHGVVRWAAQATAHGARLSLTYPLIAFGVGNVQVPGFEVFIGPVSQVAGGASLPGGSVIGAWNSARSSDQVSSVLARIAPHELRVASVFELEGVLAGVGPMPAADIVGRNWNLASLGLLLVFSSVLIGALVSMTRKRLFLRAGADGPGVTSIAPLEDARRAALRELDDLWAMGLHTQGRLREFYALSSGIVRRYVQQFDRGWGANMTSTELMRALRTRGVDELVESLSDEMSAAEVAKFSQVRHEPGMAEAHWQSVRRWIHESTAGIRER
jgi:hypothetical protein